MTGDPKRYPILVAFLCTALAPVAMAAPTLQYTLTGGGLTGTLNGTPFADATWTITAIGDAALVTTGVFLAFGPYYFLELNPTIEIQDGVNTYTAQLLNEPGQTWGVISASSVFFGEQIGFVTANTPPPISNAPGFGLIAAGSYYDLSSPSSFLATVSAADTITYSTGAGDLVIDAVRPTSGSFTVSPVPEASAVLPCGAAVAAGAFLLGRRRMCRVS